MTRYDVIGDIHGHAETLIALLEELGYVLENGTHRHPYRQAIFLGDFIDRGPQQRRVLEVVRPMVESRSALSVMGNHEFNAIAFATRDGDEYLRPHNEKNAGQHEAFLREYPLGSQEHAEMIEWFKTLPLWLDLGDIRIVHACWDRSLIAHLETRTDSGCLTDELLRDASKKGTTDHEAVEVLLKGKEIPLPEGASFQDKDGNHRHHIRIRWWDQSARMHRDAFLGPESAITHIPEEPLDRDHLIEYGHDLPPVFLGHYWLSGEPTPLASNIACLDYSVAKEGGKLVAYRWDGEKQLDARKFVAVERRG